MPRGIASRAAEPLFYCADLSQHVFEEEALVVRPLHLIHGTVEFGDAAGSGQPMLTNLSTANVEVTYNNFGLNDGTVSVSIKDYQFQFVIPIVGTTITMPKYTTTLTAESAGLIPANT